MKIGIFDSGIGGLSVYHRARKTLPGADFIYYADEKNVPYGQKPPETVRGYLKDIFGFMLEKDVKAVVVACNTATSVLSKQFRESFSLPIIGMEPAVKKAADLYSAEKKTIVVAATPNTIKGDKLKRLVQRYSEDNDIVLLPMPHLVDFAEKGVFDGEQVREYIKNCLAEVDLSKIGTYVLGCTHFNYFKKIYTDILPHSVHYVDGNEGTVNQLIRVMKLDPFRQGEGKTEFYFSGRKIDAAEKEKIDNCLKLLDEVYNI
ncbi:MAG TPA: glutamate racemase [Lachnospiraceae bacterium]|nr:glutamate racemase [Lachnospiraceae bacterium]